MSDSYEEFPTPGDPLPGEESDSNFDSKHRSKQGGSLREAKKLIGALIAFLAPFERRRIQMDTGEQYTLLAIEDGRGANIGDQEWRISVARDGQAKVFVGSLSGMGLSNEPPDGQELHEDYQFDRVGNGEDTYVCIRIVFDPESEQVGEFYRVASGGTVEEVSLEIKSEQDALDFEETVPEVGVNDGTVAEQGEYLILLGRVTGEGAGNFRIGPITLFFCAPNSFGVISDGNDFVVTNDAPA